MTDYPFLDRIPAARRLTVINALGSYQQKRHGCDLQCVSDIHAGKYNPLSTNGETIVNAPDYTEMEEIDREREPARNKEIKERME